MLCTSIGGLRVTNRRVRVLTDFERHSFRGGFDDEGGTGLGDPGVDDPYYEDYWEDYYWETWEEFEEYFEEILYGVLPPEDLLLEEVPPETYDGAESASADSALLDAELPDSVASLDEFFDMILGEPE